MLHYCYVDTDRQRSRIDVTIDKFLDQIVHGTTPLANAADNLLLDLQILERD